MSELLIIGILATLAWLSLNPKLVSDTKDDKLNQPQLNKLWRASKARIKQGRLPQAERALLTILKLDRTNAAAYNRIGLVYAAQKEYNDAVDCFEIASTIDRSPSSLNNLGHIYFETEQYEKAAIAFKKAIDLDDKLAARYLSYAKALQRLGRETEVLTAIEQAAQLEPTQETLQALFEAYLKLDMPDKALEVQAQIKNLPKSRQKQAKRPARTVAP